MYMTKSKLRIREYVIVQHIVLLKNIRNSFDLFFLHDVIVQFAELSMETNIVCAFWSIGFRPRPHLLVLFI